MISDNQPRKIVVTKLNELLIEESTLRSKMVLRRWRKDGVEVLSSGGRFSVVDGGNTESALASPYATLDFAGLGWISPGNYIGRTEANGKPYLVFQLRRPDRGSEESPEEESADQVTTDEAEPATAWFDEATRLPVKLERDGVTATFEFSRVDPMPPRLPAEVERLFEINSRRIEVRPALRPRGGARSDGRARTSSWLPHCAQIEVGSTGEIRLKS